MTKKPLHTEEKLDWSAYSECEQEALYRGAENKAEAFPALCSVFEAMRAELIPVNAANYDNYLRALIRDCHYVEKWLIEAMPKRENIRTAEEAMKHLTAEDIQQDLMKFTVLGFIRANIALIEEQAEITLAQVERRAMEELGGNNGIH